MKIGIGSPSNSSRLRLSITVVIVLMVISSPIVMLVNPAAKAAPSTADDYTSLAPSTIGQGGGDFTAQAPLSSVSARQTNNIVGAFSYYDVVFTTSTGGTIKFIDITFQSGIAIGTAPLLVESEGIGAGTATKISATQVRYTITNAVAIPAGTQIRLEFFNLVNPTSPGFYKVTVTTRNAAGTAIDGPTLSNSLNIKQIDNAQIADFAVTNSKLGTFSVTNSKLDTFSVTNSKIAPDALSIQPSQVPGPVVNIPPSTLVEASAVCPSDTFIVGGGNIMGGNTFDMRYVDGVIFEFNTWRVRATNAGSGAMTVQAYAICIPSSFP